MPARKIHTGISLDEDVLTYLDQLAARDQRTRSFIINTIVRDHAKRNGVSQESRVAEAIPKGVSQER